jgi:D-serine deaminase-like pyridoxal phosphate-dependent protein
MDRSAICQLFLLWGKFTDGKINLDRINAIYIPWKNIMPDINVKTINQITTPAIVVDLPKLKQNIAKMQGMVTGYGKRLRPHVKTHKCSEVAKLQMQAGAIGVTCATIGEAEAMASAGIRDILIANQLVTTEKLERVIRLLNVADVKFVLDSDFGIEIASRVAGKYNKIFEVLVEVDTGGKRCGTQSPEQTKEMVEKVLDTPNLRFGGIQAYNGGDNFYKDKKEREEHCRRTDDTLFASLEKVRAICDVPRVSGAGTGSALFSLKNGLLTEIQAGTYIYSDTTYRELEPEYETVLCILSTVLSRPLSSRVIMDAGLKSFGTEFSKPEVMGYEDIIFKGYSEEHTQWEIVDNAPKIGEKVKVIPSHVCTTVNHHRICYVVDGGNVVDIWKIDGF